METTLEKIKISYSAKVLLYRIASYPNDVQILHIRLYLLRQIFEALSLDQPKIRQYPSLTLASFGVVIYLYYYDTTIGYTLSKASLSLGTVS